MDDLETCKEQLKQVETALLLDPSNVELIKLASDIRDVISLTSQLIKPKEVHNKHQWKVGDKVEAVWTMDGQYYSAVIDAIGTMDEGNPTCTVTFTEYSNTDIVQLSSLRPIKVTGADAEKKRKTTATGEPIPTEKELTAAEKEAVREAKKRRQEKKNNRLEEINKAIEGVKSNWTDFTSKKKDSKGKTTWTEKPKKSIFASPDANDGKVGVGTCGIGGKGMTDFSHRGKWQFKDGEE